MTRNKPEHVLNKIPLGNRLFKTVQNGNALSRLALVLLLIYGVLSAYASVAPLLNLPHLGMLIMPILTLLAFAFAVVHAYANIGRSRMLLLLCLTFIVSMLFESVGVATGLVYGRYHYTDMLGPRFLGLVPYLIPVAWFMMIYPAQVIVEGLLGDRVPVGWRGLWQMALMSAVVMTAWDLIMDPIMVHMGFWVWEVEGDYFGIPLHNYAGWLLTTFTIFLLYRFIAPRFGEMPTIVVPHTFMNQAAWSYLITWANNTLAALQLGLTGPVVVGMLSAGVFALLGVMGTVGGRRSEIGQI
jgi:carotene biosynthesis associated membrane protein